MWFKVKSFILFLIKSTNQHGVHSPFVYNLVTKCFYSKADPSKLKFINTIKQQFLTNNKVITVSNITKVAGINKKKTALLIRILNYFEPNNILEIGTSIGLGTASLSIGNPKAKISTLEDHKNNAAVAQELFEKFQLKNIQLTIGNFNETIPSVLNNTKFDLIYFDGNHQKGEILHYFNLCLESAHNDSIFIFDDINWSSEMQQAWITIKKHPKVTISIDTYFWGFIFFRNEQEKEHFTIRV